VTKFFLQKGSRREGRRQAAAIFAACRQKLLLIPHTLSHRLVGKDHRSIHEALSGEIHKALRELADFNQKVIKPDWQPGSSDDPFRHTDPSTTESCPREKRQGLACNGLVIRLGCPNSHAAATR
jgi:hypothetical protein